MCRGARLVASVNDCSRVVLQMPRGNLESFEPRSLLLMEARRQLEQGALYECLLKLRRQRIDLNLLVDFNYQLFLSSANTLVSKCLQENAELLSLLISSLENGNVALKKYGYILYRDGDLGPHNDGFFKDKINIVCSALRADLMSELEAGKTNAMNPILCSFAKQVPPQLESALQLINNVLVQEDHRDLNGSKVSGALKYLSFLVDNESLFRAALGECDFGMCRAIARQSQMDPKVLYSLLLSPTTLRASHSITSLC